MKRWLSAFAAIAAIALILVSAHSALAQQEELTAIIVSRGDDAFKELISQFEMKTGRKVTVMFPAFIASRDAIVKGEPFDMGIVEFPHDAGVIASGNVVPGSATNVANGYGCGRRQGRAQAGHLDPGRGETHAARGEVHRLSRPGGRDGGVRS